MRRSISHIFVGVLAAPLMLLSSKAFAGSSDCGNFTALAGGGSCEVLVEGGCVAECTPLNFTAACDGKCQVEISGGCTVDCEAGCQAECTGTPGSFSCEGSCEAD